MNAPTAAVRPGTLHQGKSATTQRLSMRGGATVLRSISVFLARGRKNKGSVPLQNDGSSNKVVTATGKQKSKKMTTESDNKNTARTLEMAKRDTHFNRSEIDALYKIYRKLVSLNRPQQTDKSSGTTGNSIIGKPLTVQEGIDRMVFRELLHNTFDLVTEDILMDRIFCVWDKSSAGLLTLEAWLYGLSVFLKGTRAEQIELCFSVYDMNADGFITKDEMFHLLKNCLIKQPQEEDPDESVKDLVELILRKMDIDKDGKVSLEDFRNVVRREPLLLEAFGQCLPAHEARDTFMTTLQM